MKKAMLCVSLIIVAFALSGCSGQEEYPFDYVGIYDTDIQQSIEIGMSKDQVRDMLGDPHHAVTRYDGSRDDYDEDFSYGPVIDYDSNENVIGITVYDNWSTFDDDAENRYELSGGINFSSTVTDFTNQHTNVYKISDEFLDSEDESEVAVFVKPSDKGYDVLSKEDLIAIRDSGSDTEVYQISLSYASYDYIKEFRIERAEFSENAKIEDALIELQ